MFSNDCRSQKSSMRITFFIILSILLYTKEVIGEENSNQVKFTKSNQNGLVSCKHKNHSNCNNHPGIHIDLKVNFDKDSCDENCGSSKASPKTAPTSAPTPAPTTFPVIPVSPSLCSAAVPYSYTQVNFAATGDSSFKFALEQVSKQPIASWYTDRDIYAKRTVENCFNKCNDKIAHPVIVVYGLPQNDCHGGYSSDGFNQNTSDYQNFIETLSVAASNNPVIYILEPDAIGLLLSEPCAYDRKYDEHISLAISILSKNPNAIMYLDIGYWILYSRDNALKVAETIARVDPLNKIRGIAINSANYRTANEMIGLCKQLSDVSKKDYHCVVDTSRNFKGPSPVSEWCNTKNTGIGHPPTNETNSSIIDYFLWIKPPGESDGTCDDKDRSSDSMKGPSAGSFFKEGFVQLWNNGYYVSKGYPSISTN